MSVLRDIINTSSLASGKTARVYYQHRLFLSYSLCIITARVCPSGRANNLCGFTRKGENLMKKHLKILCAMAVAVLASAIVMLAACASSFAGTYGLSSISMDLGGMSMDIEVGEEIMGTGVSLEADAFSLVVNEDNTWSMSMNFMGEVQTETGTWRSEGGNLILVDSSNSEITATLNGSTLTMAQTVDGMSMTINFVKQ